MGREFLERRIREKAAVGAFKVRLHALLRSNERGIMPAEIKEALRNTGIVEDYPMTCFECGGEIIQEKISFIMYTKGGAPVVFEDVPADRCGQCGEKYRDAALLDRIQAVLEEGVDHPKKEIKVPVVSSAA